MMYRTFYLAAALLTTLFVSVNAVGSEPDSAYGGDVSFPIFNAWTDDYGPDEGHNVNGSPEFLVNRRQVYEDFMQGCRDSLGPQKAFRCDSTEKDRIAMTVRQTASVYNYTDTGFMKIKAPERVRKLLTDYWKRNEKNKKQERWTTGNIYVNHWESPTYMVSVEDTGLRGGGRGLKDEIWDAAKDTIEKWTGMELQPSSMYGIRVYTEGAILNPHVDRIPLISSCIVNVAQDVDEPWPLEVYDRQGNAVNVTMEPGDMVLYESHSLIHGRPYALKGRYYANIFIHFEPTGRPLYRDDIEEYVDDDLPPYIIRGSPEEDNWRSRNPGGWRTNPSPSAAHVDTPRAHMAAAHGDLDYLHELAKEDRRLLHSKDKNGWQPLHEAARSGHHDVLKSLIEDYGADMNARANHGKGASALHIANSALGQRHKAVQYLQSLGALDIGPEL